MLQICNDACKLSYNVQNVTITVELGAMPQPPSKRTMRRYFEAMLTALGCPELSEFERAEDAIEESQ